VKRNRRAAIAAAAALCLIAPAGRTAPGAEAEKWDIQVIVVCQGRYGLEAGGNSYDGSYAFTAQWVGLMERDDEDFLLIHKSVALEHWEAGEKASSPDRIELLETRDFQEKPELRVNYVLKKEGALHVALSVLGFEVPRGQSPDSFSLALPCSAEDTTAPAGIKYGAYVAEGSNNVVIDEAAIAKGTEVKKFAWTWKYRAWVQKQDQTVLVFNTHKAAVTVAVTPHQEDAGPRPGDGTCRRPAAASRG
jgi:hypothetical protein